MYISFYKCDIRLIPCPEVLIISKIGKKKINRDQTEETNLDSVM